MELQVQLQEDILQVVEEADLGHQFPVHQHKAVQEVEALGTGGETITAGTVNTGGGGGGGGGPGSPVYIGANGGSGIVIIRYKFQ
jgi:hypothetical protein